MNLLESSVNPADWDPLWLHSQFLYGSLQFLKGFVLIVIDDDQIKIIGCMLFESVHFHPLFSSSQSPGKEFQEEKFTCAMHSHSTQNEIRSNQDGYLSVISIFKI